MWSVSCSAFLILRKPHKLNSVSCFLFESPFNCALKCSTGRAAKYRRKSPSTAPLLTPQSSLLHFFFRFCSIRGCFLPPTPKITSPTGLLQPSDVSCAGRETRRGAFLAEQSRRQRSTRAWSLVGSLLPRSMVETRAGALLGRFFIPSSNWSCLPARWRALPLLQAIAVREERRTRSSGCPSTYEHGLCHFIAPFLNTHTVPGWNKHLFFFFPFSVFKQLSSAITHITLPEGVLMCEERRAERMAEERAQGSGTESQLCYSTADIQHLTFWLCSLPINW